MQQILQQAELSRLNALSVYENELISKGYASIAGIDEAGRGPLAGPVVAAACILPKNTYFHHLNDSKKLTPRVRESCFAALTQHPEICYGIGVSDVELIDQKNILQATLFAMLLAVESLRKKPDFLLIDGNQAPPFTLPKLTIVEGDAKSVSIAAASVIAKVTRDRMMLKFHEKWPEYGFDKHKGYGTKEHIEVLRKIGPCPIHRKSFEPIKGLGIVRK